MKMLAAHSGLEPWVLDVRGLLEESYKAESLFGRILEKVLTLSNAIVFIDECESLFTRRSVLAEYGSVMAQSHKKLIANFIRWSEGLETTNSFSTVYAKVDSFRFVSPDLWTDLLSASPRPVASVSSLSHDLSASTFRFTSPISNVFSIIVSN